MNILIMIFLVSGILYFVSGLIAHIIAVQADSRWMLTLNK